MKILSVALTAVVATACSVPRHDVVGYLKIVNQTQDVVHGTLTIDENGTGERCYPYEKELTVTAAAHSSSDAKMSLDCEGWVNSSVNVVIDKGDGVPVSGYSQGRALEKGRKIQVVIVCAEAGCTRQ